MGHSPRLVPVRLKEKLRAGRERLGLSQTQMARALNLDVNYSAISNYELGTREPSLPVLLKYARFFGVSMEILVDDALDLPVRLSRKP